MARTEMVTLESIMINGEEYVKKSSIQATSIAEQVDGMPYVICRTYSAGVFAGYLKRREGQEVELIDARRLWYWEGAASLSQLAVEGVLIPNKCKFPCAVPSVELMQAIEIIPCTEAARKSIVGVKVWKS